MTYMPPYTLDWADKAVSFYYTVLEEEKIPFRYTYVMIWSPCLSYHLVIPFSSQKI